MASLTYISCYPFPGIGINLSHPYHPYCSLVNTISSWSSSLKVQTRLAVFDGLFGLAWQYLTDPGMCQLVPCKWTIKQFSDKFLNVLILLFKHIWVKMDIVQKSCRFFFNFGPSWGAGGQR